MYNRWRTLRSRHGLPLFEEEGRPVCCWAGALQRTILEPCSNRRCEETVCRRTNAGNGHGAVLPEHSDEQKASGAHDVLAT